MNLNYAKILLKNFIGFLKVITIGNKPNKSSNTNNLMLEPNIILN